MGLCVVLCYVYSEGIIKEAFTGKEISIKINERFADHTVLISECLENLQSGGY